MTAISQIDDATIQHWVNNKMDVEKVEDELKSLGFDAESLRLHLNAFKKAKGAKRLGIGFIYMATGALLGFISCVITITNPIPDLFNWVLFGLTSIAVILICIGLYFVVE